MGKVAAALGMGTTIDFEGKTYKLSPWTYKIQGEFERYLEDHLYQVYKRMAPLMTPQERLVELGKIRQEVVSGQYTFGSEVVAQALTSLPHLTHLLYLMIRVAHPEVDKELVGRIVDAQMEEVMAKMAEANADPSTPPRETEGAPAEVTSPPTNSSPSSA